MLNITSVSFTQKTRTKAINNGANNPVFRDSKKDEFIKSTPSFKGTNRSFTLNPAAILIEELDIVKPEWDLIHQSDISRDFTTAFEHESNGELPEAEMAYISLLDDTRSEDVIDIVGTSLTRVLLKQQKFEDAYSALERTFCKVIADIKPTIKGYQQKMVDLGLLSAEKAEELANLVIEE